MRIRRLIPIVVVLFILAATTMTTVQHNLIGVQSGTASAQQAQQETVADDTTTQSDGISPTLHSPRSTDVLRTTRGHSLPRPGVNATLPNLKHSRIGADGQVGTLNCGLRASAPISDERTWIQNQAGGLIQIKGDGAGLNRDSDWNGYDGEPLNKLWDSHTDVFGNGAFIANGGGLFYRVRYQSQGDCIAWVAHILGIR